MDNNGVEFIGKMVFRNMKKLEKLSIKQSHIATIRNDFHYGLESLSHITYNFGGIQEDLQLKNPHFRGLENSIIEIGNEALISLIFHHLK